MQLCLGKMGMTTSGFWDLSLYELTQAIEGFNEFHYGGNPKPLHRGELEDMMERYPD